MVCGNVLFAESGVDLAPWSRVEGVAYVQGYGDAQVSVLDGAQCCAFGRLQKSDDGVLRRTAASEAVLIRRSLAGSVEMLVQSGQY